MPGVLLLFVASPKAFLRRVSPRRRAAGKPPQRPRHRMLPFGQSGAAGERQGVRGMSAERRPPSRRRRSIENARRMTKRRRIMSGKPANIGFRQTHTPIMWRRLFVSVAVQSGFHREMWRKTRTNTRCPEMTPEPSPKDVNDEASNKGSIFGRGCVETLFRGELPQGSGRQGRRVSSMASTGNRSRFSLIVWRIGSARITWSVSWTSSSRSLFFRRSSLSFVCPPNRSPGLPSGSAAEALHLRLIEPQPVQPSPGARDGSQCRNDVTDRPLGARPQHHNRFPAR